MIYKNNTFIKADMKISDIIFYNPYLILMLEHFGIQMEVQEKTIKQISKENNINSGLFLAIANLFNGFKLSTYTDCYTNDILNIVNYLKNCHTYYLNEKYPQIREYIQQIHTLNNHPEMVMIHDFFDTYFNEVKEHLVYENEVVFPYVLYLLNKNKCTDTPANYSVTEYREHHNDIEEKLYDLKNLLVKYLPIKDDQQIRRKLLFSLYELEYDLKIHSHIEIFLLIPLAEKIEQTHNKINE